MAILSSPKGTNSGSFYSNILQQNQTDTLSQQLGQIDLGVLKEKANSGGEFIDPKAYLTALQQLKQLRDSTGDASAQQAIDKKMANYAIDAQLLVKSLQKKDEEKQKGIGSGNETADEVVMMLKQQHDEDMLNLFNSSYHNPDEYAKAALEKQTEWLQQIQQAASDFTDRTGNSPGAIEKYGFDQQGEWEKFRSVLNADNQERKANFGIYVETDSRGNIKKWDINQSTDPELKNKSEYLQVNGELSNGMNVYLRKQGETTDDTTGTVQSYAKWNGINFVSTGDDKKGVWRNPTVAPTPVDEDSPIDLNYFFSGSKKAPAIYRDPGQFISTSDGKRYMYGGLDGKQDQWTQIDDPGVANELGAIQQFQNPYQATAQEFQSIVDSGLLGKKVTKDQLAPQVDALTGQLQSAYQGSAAPVNQAGLNKVNSIFSPSTLGAFGRGAVSPAEPAASGGASSAGGGPSGPRVPKKVSTFSENAVKTGAGLGQQTSGYIAKTIDSIKKLFA